MQSTRADGGLESQTRPTASRIYALVAFGLLFGWLGVILATPITVAAMVLVQKLWIREIMGERVLIPGETSKTP
jgi:predicted PurR-regulated permease PerM